jgi:HPt (histidine-containing phosphotransfer) domain-containing protein
MGAIKTDWELNPELRELAELGEHEIVADILRVFLNDAEHQLSKAEEAIRNGDGDGVRFAAHSLTGSAAAVGLNEFSEVAKQLQLLAKAHKLSESYEQLQSLRNQLPSAKQALTQVIRELKPDLPR